MNKKPRYQQIKNYILDGINQQMYLSGSKIPTELQLCEQFKVSRMTVNKAIRDLVHENRLVRYPGIGTFVSDAKAESPLADIKNIAEEVRQRNHHYSCRIIKVAETVANEFLSMQLGVPIHTKIFHSIIVHLENELPIQLENRYVIASMVPKYMVQDFTKHTPNEYLSKNFPISNVEHTVEAILPNEKAIELLDINANTPCILVNRRTWSDNRLISFACLTHPGPRYKLRSVYTINK